MASEDNLGFSVGSVPAWPGTGSVYMVTAARGRGVEGGRGPALEGTGPRWRSATLRRSANSGGNCNPCLFLLCACMCA